MKDDLKSCPFCGSEAELDLRQFFRHYRTGEPLEQVSIFCRSCDANISHYPGDLDCDRDATAFAAHRLATEARAEKLVEALRKITPIRVHDGPDYAEVYFADGTTHSTQAMTMNPRDWHDIAAALSEYAGERRR